MKRSLFITGASGFIATGFLKKLNLKEYNNVYCLSRHGSETITLLSQHDNFTFIKGSVADTGLYDSYLASSDIVMHLAAATGKAKPEEYFRVNSEGTKLLVDQCVRYGVRKFLFVSSISVKFLKVSKYYYAQSKQKAEEIVRQSGLDHTIIRPTIVIGKNSSILQSLVNLVKIPIVPIFGSGATNIQPIYIDDLVTSLLYIIGNDIFMNESFDLGGPEIISFKEFIIRIHRIYSKKELRFITIPLSLIIPLFSFFEKLFFPFMPFSVGQLSAFYCDGTIEDNRLFQGLSPGMKNVDEMLELVGDNLSG